MLNSLNSLRQLEGLVKQASEALQKIASENRTLREKLARLEGDHKRLKEELHSSKEVLSRHARLRARLLRLSEKLEKIS